MRNISVFSWKVLVPGDDQVVLFPVTRPAAQLGLVFCVMLFCRHTVEVFHKKLLWLRLPLE